MSNNDVNCNNDSAFIEISLSSLNNSSCLDAFGLCNSHVINTHEMMRVILSKLYSAWVVLSCVPPNFKKVVYLLLKINQKVLMISTIMDL